MDIQLLSGISVTGVAPITDCRFPPTCAVHEMP
jgi:hypothetical protein